MSEMPDSTQHRLELLSSNSPIPRDVIINAINSNEISKWHLAYGILTRAYARIEPPYAVEDALDFLLRYFLRCMKEGVAEVRQFDPDEDAPHSAYEAAWELVPTLIWAWNTGHSKFVEAIVNAINEMYDVGGEAMRDCIECGFLEHVLECPEVRHLFADWQTLPCRREAYHRALAYKWIRIIFRLWKTNILYTEAHYLQQLRSKNSPLLQFLENG